MWEFYLAISEMAFREKDLMVFQMQLSKSRTAVPLTRDYSTQWEYGYGGRRHLNGMTHESFSEEKLIMDFYPQLSTLIRMFHRSNHLSTRKRSC